MATHPWWHGMSIYQVYPRSFADSDGDGIGDLQGLISRLDYIADLGVDTIWVSPFFASPQLDFGYDITDYTGVAEEYGTLADVRELIDQTHARGMRIMFDLVLNHTSDQHPWFVRSRGSRTNPKSDWYIWADGTGRNGRRPPNNWRSYLEVTSAWQWCPTRGQFYLATFLPFQPDLNWRNPDVKAAMFDVVRFWLEMGVDGFRLDIFGLIMKDPQLRSNPFAPKLGGGHPVLWRRQFNENLPENMALARELHAVCAEFSGDRILLGEVFGTPEVLSGFLAGGEGLNLVFLFDFLEYSYDAQWFADTIRRFERSFPAPSQPTYVLENHDRSRTIDRVGGDPAKAAVLAIILLTLRGVPTVYNGQEIGMSNTYLPMKSALDPVASRLFSRLPEVVNRRLTERLNRDEVRTPMQWDASANAGFCPPGVTPWLPVNPRSTSVNVAAQTGVDGSLLELYRSLLTLRRDHSALREGELNLVAGMPLGILAYRRTADETFAVYANLAEHSTRVNAGDVDIVLAVGGVRQDGDQIVLDADSATIVQQLA